MQIIFVGTKNFDFFSRVILDKQKKILLISKSQKLPDWLITSSTVIRVEEIYDYNSKTFCLDIDEAIIQLTPLVTSSNFRVFCNQEANLEVADHIREHFSLYDHLNGNVENFRNKLTMKEIVLRAGLRAPTYTELSSSLSVNDYENLHKTLKGKFIIKPCASVGSRGVYKIAHEADFDRFLTESAGDECRYEAEEFIEGDLYEYDLAIQEGKIIYSAISRYSCPMADLQEGRTLGSIMISRELELHSRISTFGLQCVQALGAVNGCFHMELFHSINDELVFLEVAARSPGLMTVPAYQSWEGINLYDIELLIQSNIDASVLAQAPKGYQSRPAFFVVFPKINGTVVTLNQPKLNGHVEIDWQVAEGERVSATTTNIDFAGKAFVCTDNEIDALKAFHYLVNEFTPVVYQ
ncbi:MAG: ATP-grasp domain-containing protein [Proteobacteria bacterium]|nr:ATP-grasp domain-containing protein [Pseudomonadota bacterium]